MHENGIVLDVNQIVVRMTGYEVTELINKNTFDIVILTSKDLIGKYIISGYKKPGEIILIKKDGSYFPVEIKSKNIYC